MKISVPEPPRPSENFSATVKCRTCAYHRPSTEEEDEMAIDYFHEHPLPHPCHERKNGIACVGSMDSLERLTEWRRA
jgi:hypothetical protein